MRGLIRCERLGALRLLFWLGCTSLLIGASPAAQPPQPERKPAPEQDLEGPIPPARKPVPVELNGLSLEPSRNEWIVAADHGFLYLLRGDRLYKISEATLEVVKSARLELASPRAAAPVPKRRHRKRTKASGMQGASGAASGS